MSRTDEAELPPLPTLDEARAGPFAAGEGRGAQLLEHVNLSVALEPEMVHQARLFYGKGLGCRRNWTPQAVFERHESWGFWVDAGFQQFHVPVIPTNWCTNVDAAPPSPQLLAGTVVIGVVSLDRLAADLAALQSDLRGTLFEFSDESDIGQIRIRCPFGNRLLARQARPVGTAGDGSDATRAYWLNADRDTPGLPCHRLPPPAENRAMEELYWPETENTVSIIGLELPCLPEAIPSLAAYWRTMAPCNVSEDGRELRVTIGTDQSIVFRADENYEGAPPRNRNNPHICLYLPDPLFRDTWEMLRDRGLLYHSHKRYATECLPQTWDQVEKTGQYRIRDVPASMETGVGTVYELEIEVRGMNHRLCPYVEHVVEHVRKPRIVTERRVDEGVVVDLSPTSSTSSSVST